MKKIPKYILLSLFSLMLMAAQTSAQEQTKKDRKKAKSLAISQLVSSRHFSFDARSVSPSGGPTRQLTSYYDLTLKGDTLVAALPYFGRAYSGPLNSSEGGINFRSTNFSYQTVERKKGGWNILIKPKDVNSTQQLNLSISENGQASLEVTSNNRQPISFMGTITETRK